MGCDAMNVIMAAQILAARAQSGLLCFGTSPLFGLAKGSNDGLQYNFSGVSVFPTGNNSDRQLRPHS